MKSSKIVFVVALISSFVLYTNAKLTQHFKSVQTNSRIANINLRTRRSINQSSPLSNQTSPSTSEPSPESDGTSEPSPESGGTPEPSLESGGASEPSPESGGTSEPSPESDGTSEPSPESGGTSEPSPESGGTSEPSPESDGTSEPSPESGGTSEPSPESGGTSEPSPESDGTSEPSPESGGTSEPSPESGGTSEPSPESDGTSEPSPESGGKSEPSPESENIPERSPADRNSYPEPNPQGVNTKSEPGPPQGSAPEAEPESWPEPGPDWDKAYKLWQNAWPAHTYIFAIIFLAMAFYSGYYIVVNVKDGLGKKYLSISLNVMMCILSVTRSFVLFLDPYHQGTLIENKLVLQVMWSLGTPCLLASDSLCILALAESANVNLMHQRFQRLSNILIIIFLHFLLVITTDVVVSSHSSAKVMILYCQVFSIIWGMLLGFWYFNLAHKINHVLFKAAGRRKSRGDKMYLLLIYLSCAANLFGCILILYSAVGVFGIYSDVQFVGAWPWFTFQTGLRVSEVFAALLVFTVSAKRNRIKNKVHNAIVCGQQQIVNETTSSINTPSVNNLYPAARNRRMSMFSVVHQSKMTAQDDHLSDNSPKLNSLTWQQPANVSVGETISNPRGRRMSLFSELHESKLSATNGGATPHRNKLSGLHQSLNSAFESENNPTGASNSYKISSGRRMSMFSQLQQLKLSENANNSTPSSLKNTRTSTSVIRKPTEPAYDDDGNLRSAGNGRRMSMFSQLQHIKLSASANKFPNGDKESEGNEQVDTTGIRTGLHQLVASHRKRGNKSELDDNSKHSNFFSKFFHAKVSPVSSSSPNAGGRINKLAGLCHNDASVEKVNAEVRVNATPNACESTKTTDWRSRTSLFASLADASTKLDEMKIIEDDEEEEMETDQSQVFNCRKSSEADATYDRDKETVIAMNYLKRDSMSISRDSDKLTPVDL